MNAFLFPTPSALQGKNKKKVFDGKRDFWACRRLNKNSYVFLTL